MFVFTLEDQDGKKQVFKTRAGLLKVISRLTMVTGSGSIYECNHYTLSKRFLGSVIEQTYRIYKDYDKDDKPLYILHIKPVN